MRARKQFITLQEYGSRRLPAEALQAQDGALLWRRYDAERGIIQVVFPSPRTGGQWELTALGWVGHIPLTPELALILEPKVPLHNLWGMLEVAYGLQSFHFLDGLTRSDSLPEVYERLASVLARRVLQRVQVTGLYGAYVPQRRRLPAVRGRIDLQALLKEPAPALVPCDYDDRTADVPHNQILAWTLRRIAQSGLCGGDAQQLVRRAYHSLEGEVTPVPVPASACTGLPYNRLNDDYRSLHALCHFFLEHSGPGHRCGERQMLPFLVNVARLFERFVAQWLHLHLPAPWTVRTQEQVALAAEEGSLQFQLDLVLYDGDGDPWAVVDTKYKAVRAPDAADVAQVVAYAQSIGCSRAVLVYPQAPAQPLDARAGDVRVRSLSFPLDGELQAGGAHFLEELGEIQPISGSGPIQL